MYKLITILFLSLKLHAADTAFVTSVTYFGAKSNNYTGYLGFKVTIGTSPVSVTHLGRWVHAGNFRIHNLKIVDNANRIIVQATINTTGQPVGFTYVQISPVTLFANTVYYVLSEELIGGDLWCELSNVLTTSVGKVNNAVYGVNNINHTGVAGQSYVPVNFKYQTSVPPPVIIQPPTIPPPTGSVTDFLKTLPGYIADGSKVLFSDFTWRTATIGIGTVGPQGPQGIQGLKGETGPAGTGSTGKFVLYLKPPLYPANDSTIGYK